MDAPGKRLELEIRSELSELERVIATLDEAWRTAGLAEGTQADLNIAVEEMLSNSIRHGGATGRPIAMQVSIQGDGVTITIVDEGVAFDPLVYPLPDPAAPLEARRPGGLGILMVRQMMDEVSYQRRDGRNCLCLYRRLER